MHPLCNMTISQCYYYLQPSFFFNNLISTANLHCGECNSLMHVVCSSLMIIVINATQKKTVRCYTIPFRYPRVVKIFKLFLHRNCVKFFRSDKKNPQNLIKLLYFIETHIQNFIFFRLILFSTTQIFISDLNTTMVSDQLRIYRLSHKHMVVLKSLVFFSLSRIPLLIFAPRQHFRYLRKKLKKKIVNSNVECCVRSGNQLQSQSCFLCLFSE